MTHFIASLNNAMHQLLFITMMVILRSNLGKSFQIKSASNVIHIGNLDWSIPSSCILQELTGIIEKISISHMPDINIRPKTPKKRDELKYHGGSCKLIFQSSDDAELVMCNLQSLPDTLKSQLSSSSSGELQIRWVDIGDVQGYQNNTMQSNSYEDDNRNHKEKTNINNLISHRKERAQKYAKKRRSVALLTDKLLDSVESYKDEYLNIIPKYTMLDILDAPTLPWSDAISHIDPRKGGGIKHDTLRATRKKAQVEAMVHVIEKALLWNSNNHRNGVAHCTESDKQRFLVADLACGAGNLALPIAWFLRNQNVDVVGVDINEYALKKLISRASKMNIDSEFKFNISAITQDLLDLIPAKIYDDEKYPLSHCDAVVSLHACGAASDLAIAAAVGHSLPFAVSPCCIGKVNFERELIISDEPISSSDRSGRPEQIRYPRSNWLDMVLSSSSDNYKAIATAADYSVPNLKGKPISEDEHIRINRGRRAKLIVEYDRLLWAKERGYYVRLVEIPRLDPLYPKRELLLGAKRGTDAANQIRNLEVNTN